MIAKREKNVLTSRVTTQIVLRARLADWPYSVWRDIAIRGEATFIDLHNKLQQVFVWYDDHAHLFEFKDDEKEQRRRYVSQGLWEEDRGPDEVESKVSLRSERLDVGQKFTYEYDMGDSIEVSLEVREVSPLDERTLPRPVKARTLALRGFAPEQYAYRGDPHRYSQRVRKMLERGESPVVKVSLLKDELKVIAEWSDYDNPWRSYWKDRPTQQEILRAIKRSIWVSNPIINGKAIARKSLTRMSRARSERRSDTTANNSKT